MKPIQILLLFTLLTFGAFSQKGEALKKEHKQFKTNCIRAERIMYSNIDSAKIYAKRALTISKSIKNRKFKAQSYLILSSISLRDNDLPKSFEYIELMEILASDLEDQEMLAQAQFQKGTLFMVIGNEEKSIELLSEAEKYFAQTKDSSNLATTYNSLSLLYKRSGNMDKAISTIKKAIKICRGIDSKYTLAASLGNLSEYYRTKKDFEGALTSIRETHNIFVNMKSNPEIARSLISIGDLYFQNENYDSSLIYLDRAEALIIENNLEDPNLDLWAARGAIEMKMGNYPEALKFFQQEYELATKYGISELMQSSLENMYKSAKEMGDSNLALEFLEQFKQMSDSLEKISGKEALVALELNKKFEHEQSMHEAEKKELIVKKENSELEADKKNYLILCLILAGILIAFVASILIRKKQKAIGQKEEQKQVLTDELELKNKELVSSAIQILRKSEEMKKTIESLQELNERANPSDSQLLLSIIRKLKFELEHNSWEEFEVPFRQLHSRFYTKLVEKYPELTRAEIKVCSLLKLNLDTKQISSILHKTSASIEVDRSRIRKKMGLTNTKTSLSRHISTNI